MSLKALLYNGSKGEWDRYVEAHPEASGYHFLRWREVIERSFGHRTYYLAAQERNGELRGALPLVYMKSGMFGKFLVSLPFLNYGGVISSDSYAAEALISEASYILKGLSANHVELRHLNKMPGRLAARQHKVTMILSLAENPEKQWAAFDAKLRNQIRKGVKSGLQFRVGKGEYVNAFYAVFARNMRDLGTPVYCRQFFHNIVAAFPDNVRIFLVTQGEQVVAGGVAFWHKETLEIPWASSLREYRSLCPNNILYWEAIKYAIENGFKRFDFGRSTVGEGTYKFKEQWGAKPIPMHWQYLMRENRPLPELSPSNPKFQLAIRIWQRLPLPVANLLGPPIVRNIP